MSEDHASLVERGSDSTLGWDGNPENHPLVSAPATGRTAGAGEKKKPRFPPGLEPAGPTIADDHVLPTAPFFQQNFGNLGTLVFEPNRKATDGQASRALRDTVSRLEERSKKLSEEKDRFQTLYAYPRGCTTNSSTSTSNSARTTTLSLGEARPRKKSWTDSNTHSSRRSFNLERVMYVINMNGMQYFFLKRK